MTFNNKNSLVENGFEGFVSIQELWVDRSAIPKFRGVYLVTDPNFDDTQFIDPGVGGFFKGKDPNVDIEVLKSNVVSGAEVVYIGKAGSPMGKATLHSRLGQYLRFGQTKNVGHWGGRLIWQIKKHEELVYCWKTVENEDPREVEKSLLSDFQNQYGQRPFANLTG